MKAPDAVLVALTFANDTVGIMAFVTTEYRNGVPVWSRPPTPENVQAEIAKASASFDAAQLPVKSWRLVAREELPKDRTFRNALRDQAGKLGFDMAHAREIHRDHIREARAYEMAVLDVESVRAMESALAANHDDIIVRKQALRRAPADPAIEACQTPEELKACWPEALRERAQALGYL